MSPGQTPILNTKLARINLACLEEVGPERENIEVYGSHSGLGFNPAAIYAITDRLAHRPGDWKPFRAPPGTDQFFPPAADWSPRAA